MATRKPEDLRVPHPGGPSARRDSKAMTSPPGIRPPATRTARAARAPEKTGARNPLATFGCIGTSDPQERPTRTPRKDRRPRIPSCLSTLSNNNASKTIRRPGSLSGTRYIDSSPPPLKALFREIAFVNLGIQVLDPTLRLS